MRHLSPIVNQQPDMGLLYGMKMQGWFEMDTEVKGQFLSHVRNRCEATANVMLRRV